MDSKNEQKITEISENAMNVPSIGASNNLDLLSNSSKTLPCANDDVINGSSLLEPSWRSMPKTLNHNAHSAAETIRVNQAFLRSEAPLLKPIVLYTCIPSNILIRKHISARTLDQSGDYNQVIENLTNRLHIPRIQFNLCFLRYQRTHTVHLNIVLNR